MTKKVLFGSEKNAISAINSAAATFALPGALILGCEALYAATNPIQPLGVAIPIAVAAYMCAPAAILYKFRSPAAAVVLLLTSFAFAALFFLGAIFALFKTPVAALVALVMFGYSCWLIRATYRAFMATEILKAVALKTAATTCSPS